MFYVLSLSIDNKVLCYTRAMLFSLCYLYRGHLAILDIMLYSYCCAILDHCAILGETEDEPYTQEDWNDLE
ncbi:hypothetical protein Taro_035728 [Colocasia esculenta]|uniref:Uncharacterized protein n=1 Tax=Colocasia esculenta TaxID=4460 RepID=A0A843VVC2_COLES|nr:hypothetical protein [Colocasia esculenta]